MKVVTQLPNTFSMGLLLTLQKSQSFLMVERENRLQLSHWDHNGNKCLHFFVSSFYLMYFVFISYVYLYIYAGKLADVEV